MRCRMALTTCKASCSASRTAARRCGRPRTSAKPRKPMVRIACVLTCHNRRATTLQCLRALHACALPPDARLSVHLVDDGSSDGTGAAVRSEFPDVVVIDGDGALFWAGGMRRAKAAAMATNPDFYLWLNDDTTLDEHAIAELLRQQRAIAQDHPSQPTIVSAAVRDPHTGECSYGGIVSRSRWYPWFVNAG